MASTITNDPVNDAYDSVKKHCQVLWLTYLQSIQRGVPQLFIPKAMADEMGAESIAHIISRMGYFTKFTMVMQYDPVADAYLIGALDQMRHEEGHVKIMEVPYVEPPPVEDSSAEEMLDAEAESVEDDTPEKPLKIRKPPNMFILYRRDMQPMVKAEHPEAHNNDISVIVGKMWHDETPEVRNMYKDRAAEVKSKFMLEHPDWKCSPRKSSEIKKRSVSAESSTSANSYSSFNSYSTDSSLPADTSSQTLATETQTEELAPANHLTADVPEVATAGAFLNHGPPVPRLLYGTRTPFGIIWEVYNPIVFPVADVPYPLNGASTAPQWHPQN